MQVVLSGCKKIMVVWQKKTDCLTQLMTLFVSQNAEKLGKTLTILV